MPVLDPAIVARLGDRAFVTPFILDLLTPTRRAWTNYRGYASNGQRGLTIGVFVTGATVTSGGTGYTTAPAVSVTSGGGSGAVFTATIGAGQVTALTLVSPGFGYTSAPAIAFSGGGGSGAAATATTAPGFFKAFDVAVPGIEETEGAATVELEITIANATNLATDLVSNAANIKRLIRITKLWVLDATVKEATPPTVVKEQPWFDGRTGAPELDGEQVRIRLHADMGRRGSSPKTDSMSLMASHAPLPEGTKITITPTPTGGW